MNHSKEQGVRDEIGGALNAMKEDVGAAGGQANVARLMGLSLPSIRATLNSPDRQPNLYFVVRLIGETGGRNLLAELCRLGGGIFVPMPESSVAADVALHVLEHAAKTVRDFAAAEADGRITGEEVNLLSRDAADAQAALGGLVKRVAEQHEESRRL
jgi:hypothetical protein